MRICIATTSFPRWVGDYRAPFIFEAARALQKQGHEVRVVTLHSPGAAGRETWNGIDVFRARYLPERWEMLQKEAGGLPVMWRTQRLARVALGPFLFAQAAAIARLAPDADLIHANWTLSGMAAWLGQSVHRKPFIVTVHGSDLFEGAKNGPLRFLTRATLGASAGVVCVSRSLQDAALRLGINSSKVQVIPDGVDVSKFRPTDEPREPILLFVGALTKEKGIQYLLQALPHVASHFRDIRVVIIGDGPQRAELQEQAESLEFGDHVEFLGAQCQEEVSLWMRRARFFVLPSLSEGLGVVLLEALSSGTPCVASRVGGIPDILNDRIGLLVPPADAKALATAIVRFLSIGEDEYQEMSRQARAHAMDIYDWNRIAARLTALYHQALSPGKARGRNETIA